MRERVHILDNRVELGETSMADELALTCPK